MWYYSGVISSLIRPNYQLRAFNKEVTASPRIAPPPCPHSYRTVLVLLFGTTGKVVLEGVLLSPSVTLVGRGHDDPRWCLLAAWAFFTHPRTFLLSRRGPWAWYEMDWILANSSAPQYYLGVILEYILLSVKKPFVDSILFFEANVCCFLCSTFWHFRIPHLRSFV